MNGSGNGIICDIVLVEIETGNASLCGMCTVLHTGNYDGCPNFVYCKTSGCLLARLRRLGSELGASVYANDESRSSNGLIAGSFGPITIIVIINLFSVGEI